MTSITIGVDDVSDISNGSVAALSGKNGFKTIAGRVPLLVETAPQLISGSPDKVGLIVNNLKDVIDVNFNKHVLNVNDGIFAGLKGYDFISVPLKEKTGTDADFGFVGFNTDIAIYSANITYFDVANNMVQFNNDSVGGSSLFNVLDEQPFYVDLFQILDMNFFANNSVYIAGTIREVEKSTDVSALSGPQSFELTVVPRNKKFISVFKDGIKLDNSDFTHTDGSSSISLVLSGVDNNIRTVVEDYTVPAIEIGDNVHATTNNVYSISNTSYDPLSETYNAHLTANCIYRVGFETKLAKNLAGDTLTNISTDIVGSVGNSQASTNSFTIDYSPKRYPGNFHLGNNKIYSVQVPLSFNPISLGEQGIITDAPQGLNIVKARTVNPIGRKSPFVTQSVDIRNSPIQKVSDLTITEFLALGKNTTQGVIVNADISFTHIIGQDINTYEVSFKLGGEAGDSINFTTIMVPAIGVEDDGKIRVKLTDLERGRVSGVNSLTVRVTAISSTDIRGISTEKTVTIVGKTAKPQNVSKFVGGQTGTDITLAWAFPTNTDGSVVDLDLLEIELRRVRGEVSPSTFNSNWLIARPVEKVPVPSTSIISPIKDFGTNTFLIRTRDTSKNESSNVNGITITTTRPLSSTAFALFSEDDPAGNVVVGLPNDNADEVNYPSFTDSTNGGFALADSLSTETENANGTSSGWSSIAQVTDLFASDDAVYQTQIRDLGVVTTATVLTSFEGSQATRLTFNDFRKDLIESVTDGPEPHLGNVLVDNSFGGIGNILSSNSATYDVSFGTLKDPEPSGNVYAIWNSGQFATDGANANTFALIAGVINTNAIALGATYFANGAQTSGNILPNLTSNIMTYQLVDLQQFTDPDGSFTFQGQDKVTDLSIKVRYSAASNVYHANGNVNVAAFAITGGDSQGFKDWVPVEETFRYFQLRYELENTDPTSVDFTVDVITYTADLKSKTYSDTVAITATPTLIDYSSAGFARAPIPSGTPISAGGGNVVSFSDIQTNNCNVRVFNTVDATFTTGLNINFTAEGI